MIRAGNSHRVRNRHPFLGDKTSIARQTDGAQLRTIVEEHLRQARRWLKFHEVSLVVSCEKHREFEKET